MIVRIGDLTFKDGVLTPPASWNRVEFPQGRVVSLEAQIAIEDNEDCDFADYDPDNE